MSYAVLGRTLVAESHLLQCWRTLGVAKARNALKPHRISAIVRQKRVVSRLFNKRWTRWVTLPNSASGAPLFKRLNPPKCWGTLGVPAKRGGGAGRRERPPMGFSPAAYSRFFAKNDVCGDFVTILFAKNRERWNKRATLLNSAFGAANVVGRNDESYCSIVHPCRMVSRPKVPGNIGCPREAKRGGGGTPRRPPRESAPMYIRDFSSRARFIEVFKQSCSRKNGAERRRRLYKIAPPAQQT